MERVGKCGDSEEPSTSRGKNSKEVGRCYMEKKLCSYYFFRISYGTFITHKTATIVHRTFFMGKA